MSETEKALRRFMDLAIKRRDQSDIDLADRAMREQGFSTDQLTKEISKLNRAIMEAPSLS